MCLIFAAPSWEEITAISSVVAGLGALAAAGATVVLAVIGAKGLKQLAIAVESLDIAKKDVRSRSEREAKSAAFKECERFRTEIIPANSKLIAMIAEAHVAAFVSEKDQLSFNYSDQLLVRKARDWVVATPQPVNSQMIEVLNMLETWSLTFNSGIGDASIAYRPTSDVFCRAVVQNYPMLMFLRGTRTSDLFSNVEELYRDWNGRKAATELERQEKILSSQLEQVRKYPKPPEHRKPIGTDI